MSALADRRRPRRLAVASLALLCLADAAACASAVRPSESPDVDAGASQRDAAPPVDAAADVGAMTRRRGAIIASEVSRFDSPQGTLATQRIDAYFVDGPTLFADQRCATRTLDGCRIDECALDRTLAPPTFVDAGPLQVDSPSSEHLTLHQANGQAYDTRIDPVARLWAAGAQLRVIAEGVAGLVPPFAATAVVPSDLTLTEPMGLDINTPYRFTRADGARVAWSGATDGEITVRLARSFETGTRTVTASCTAPAAAGRFRVPDDVLNAVATATGDADGLLEIWRIARARPDAGDWDIVVEVDRQIAAGAFRVR